MSALLGRAVLPWSVLAAALVAVGPAPSVSAVGARFQGLGPTIWTLRLVCLESQEQSYWMDTTESTS